MTVTTSNFSGRSQAACCPTRSCIWREPRWLAQLHLFAASVLPCLLVLAIVGCAPYQIGARTLYRPQIQTVYVPVFESDSYRRQLGEELTEAVAKQIDAVTPYRLADHDRADSILSGRILTDAKTVIVEDLDDQPRDIQVQWQVEVSWRDRNGELLAQPFRMDLPMGMTGLGQAVHLVPEAGQSMATAQLELVDKLAQQIVARMEAPW
ncbi:MAG: LptE family protein [Pirellulaceae bacterium]